MHYDSAEILKVAVPVDDYWKEAKIVLEKGDTAYAPGTTKKVLAGTGEIRYMISATGWQANTDPGIRVDYI